MTPPFVTGYFALLQLQENPMILLETTWSFSERGNIHRAFYVWINVSLSFLYMASPQQGDLRLSGPPSGQGAKSGARTRDRRVPADLRADSQATVLPKPPRINVKMTQC
ncbi:hypothetical protein PoB_004553400 [Plakobranchus ocellatus]|uniref:Uncharacterized protein n=1 Tax=Plakobranchus ocellatus TaxID=259542 RepID=A0AAV4BJD7_9GAST|nr:hypothetical protein PoB_004553400 [Plakobranchus ocellatus]